MAMNGVEIFLQAEAEAARLVEELTRLQSEIESYQTARSALTDTSTALSDLSIRLAGLADQLGSAVETLRTIGTSELIDVQAGIAAELTGLRADQQRESQAVTGALHHLAAGIQSIQESLNSAEAKRLEDQAAWQRALLDLEENQQREVEATRKTLEAELQATRNLLDARFETTSTALSQIRRLGIAAVVGAAILVALVVWQALVLLR